MGLGRFIKKGLKKALPAVAKMTPVGRTFSLAGTATKVIGKASSVARAGLQFGGAGGTSLLGAVERVVGVRKRKKRFKGISGQEMMELMKLQMLVGKRSMPYQMAVMRAITGKLK